MREVKAGVEGERYFVTEKALNCNIARERERKRERERERGGVSE